MKIDNKSVAVLIVLSGVCLPIVLFLDRGCMGSGRRAEIERQAFIQRPDVVDGLQPSASLYAQDDATPFFDRLLDVDDKEILTLAEEDLLARGVDYNYTITAGDTLATLALKYLGDRRLVQLFFDVNPGLVPGEGLLEGQSLLIPFSQRP
ncbi:MAG: LysM domain-containing protein [Planctomycetota bacterium]